MCFTQKCVFFPPDQSLVTRISLFACKCFKLYLFFFSFYITDRSFCIIDPVLYTQTETDGVELEEEDSDSSGRRMRNVAQVKD